MTFPDLIHPDGHERTPAELRVHHRLLDGWDIGPNEPVIVAGAFEGYVVRRMVEHCPGYIYGFEPQGGLGRVWPGDLDPFRAAIFPYGLGVREGTFPMVASGTMAASFLVGERAMHGYAEADGFGALREWGEVMADLGIEHVALLHLNVEQYEYILLPHLFRTGWLPRIRQLVVEVHTNPNPPPDAWTWEAIDTVIRETHRPLWQEGPWWAYARPDALWRDPAPRLPQ